jgi:8-amino-7-oxononanoate synthase
VRFWNGLLAEGVYTNLALGPATPGGRPLLRMSVSAALEAEQIDFAVAAIAGVGRALGVLGDGSTAAAAAAAAAAE